MKISKSELQLESLVSRISNGELDLQPDFQRGEIWDNPRRQRLIDTILRDWYVPAVHIVKEADGAEVVLDGQQRLAAIRDFFAGKFAVDGRIEPVDDEIRRLHGLKYPKLPEQYQRALNRFSLQIITLEASDPREPNELFFRLNQSYNLTPPEKRNALHGPARLQVRELVDDLVGSGFLNSQTIGFSNSRLAYDDVISRACVAVQVGSLRRHINNNVVEEFYRGDGFDERTIEGVRAAAGRVFELIQASPERVKFNKGTLQTWVTYAHWAPELTGPLPHDLLVRFERDRALVRLGLVEAQPLDDQRLLEVVAVYDDRAAYRVTDVSSVVARDLAIHLYSQANFGTAAIRGSDALLRDVRVRDDAAPQLLLAEFQEAVNWGDPLV